MNNEDRINLIGGLALIVVGIGGMYVSMRAVKKLEQSYDKDAETFKQRAWRQLADMDFYVNSSLEEQEKYFDAFWKPTKNEK